MSVAARRPRREHFRDVGANIDRTGGSDRPRRPDVFAAAAAELIARYPAGQAPLGAAAAAAPRAVRAGLRHARRHRVLRRHARAHQGAGGARSPPSTRCTSARPPANTWSASAPTRCAGCSAATRSSRRCREHLGVGTTRPTADGIDHLGARRVPGRLRLRAGRHGELRVLRQPDRRLGAHAGQPSCRRASGRTPTRGAPLCTFKRDRAADRRLPRPEALALEANGSGAPTEAGVRLALERESVRRPTRIATSDTTPTAPGTEALGQPTSAARCAADHGRVGLREPRTARWTEGGLTCR